MRLRQCTFNLLFLGARCAQEHVQNCRTSAQCAVASMLDPSTPEYDYLPYFYSRIFNLSWQAQTLLFRHPFSATIEVLTEHKAAPLYTLRVICAKPAGLVSTPGIRCVGGVCNASVLRFADLAAPGACSSTASTRARSR
jgi:hypothetical protein